MVGSKGSVYHRRIAIPAVLRLARIERGTRVLDVGCGQGVLAPHVHRSGGRYVGVDASAEMIAHARTRRGRDVDLRHGDARALHEAGIGRASFDVGVFMLSIQDMDPLPAIVASTAAALAPSARIVIVMTHPCFRVPRGSGWGFDEGRKLTYRRVDRYLEEAAVPMKEYAQVSGRATGVTIAFHRPLTSYVAALAEHGFAVDALEELPDLPEGPKGRKGNDEIPLFMALRAVRRG